MYLGVTLSNKLTWWCYEDKVVKIGNQKLAFLNRNPREFSQKCKSPILP